MPAKTRTNGPRAAICIPVLITSYYHFSSDNARCRLACADTSKPPCTHSEEGFELDVMARYGTSWHGMSQQGVIPAPGTVSAYSGNPNAPTSRLHPLEES